MSVSVYVCVCIYSFSFFAFCDFKAASDPLQKEV